MVAETIIFSVVFSMIGLAVGSFLGMAITDYIWRKKREKSINIICYQNDLIRELTKKKGGEKNNEKD